MICQDKCENYREKPTRIRFQCICDSCNETIIISDDLRQIIDEIPNHQCSAPQENMPVVEEPKKKRGKR